MIIKLCKYYDDLRVINKSFRSWLDFNVNLRNDFNLINPEIILLSDENDFLEYNYCLIVELERYYFINGIVNLGNNLYKVKMDVDLLETYKNVILSSPASYFRKLKEGDYIDNVSDLSVESIKTKYVSDVIFPDIKETLMITVGA